MNRIMLGHALRRALRSLRENAYLNAVGVGVIAASLLLVGVTMSLERNVAALMSAWGQDVHVSAWFAPGVTEAQREEIRATVASLPDVVAVQYVSEAEAAAWMTEQVEGIGPVLEDLGPDALPASLELTLDPRVASDPAAVAAFAEALARPELADIDYGAAWVERFQAFLSLLKLMGAVLGLLVMVAAVFLVINTVNLIVYSRRDELEIQKLVGGTTEYILAPFLLEGLVQGLLGAALALTGLWAVHRLLVVRLQETFGLQSAGELLFPPASALAVLVLSGAAVGLIAAGVAAARALRRAP